MNTRELLDAAVADRNDNHDVHTVLPLDLRDVIMRAYNLLADLHADTDTDWDEALQLVIAAERAVDDCVNEKYSGPDEKLEAEVVHRLIQPLRALRAHLNYELHM